MLLNATKIKLNQFLIVKYLSELESDLPEGYDVPEHFYDIWHFIKVRLR